MKKRSVNYLSEHFSKVKKLFLIMRLTVILTLLFSVSTMASVYSQSAKLSVNVKNTTLESVFDKLAEQSEFQFVYNDEVVAVVENITANFENATVEQILDEVLKNYDLDYQVVNNVVVITPAPGKTKPNNVTEPAEQKKIKFSGKVIDEEGKPVPFAAVVIKNTTIGAATNENGEFEFEAEEGDYSTLVVSSVGYLNEEIEIGNQTNFDIALTQDIAGLDEVMVTGYQTISRERSTGSFVKLKSDQIEQKRLSDLNTVLEGQIAGFSDGVIRGVTSMQGLTTPLYVIDGFPVENTRYTQYGSLVENLPDLNLEDIESITVLKDAAATSIYGARAANGVVVIMTRKASKGQTNVSFSSNLTVSPYRYYTETLTDAGDIVGLEQEWATGNPKLQATDGSAATYAQSLLTNAVFTSQGMQSILNYYAGNQSEAEMNSQLSTLKGMGYQYYNDVEKYAKQNKFYQQYNVSIGKATDQNNFMASVTYKNNKFEDIYSKDQSVGVDMRNTTEITKWLSVDLGNYFSYQKGTAQTYNPLAPGFVYQPYNRLVDDSGNPFVSTAESRLSQSTIDAINNYGLYNMDITPLDELGMNLQKSKNFANRTNVKLNIKITDWLKYNAMFQYEYAVDRTEQLKNKESYAVRNLVNRMASLNSGNLVYNLPYGDIYNEVQQYSNSYNFRQQIDFSKTFAEKHDLTVIAGTETRNSKLEYRGNTLYNYDADILSFTPVDQKSLTSFYGSLLGGSSVSNSDFAVIRELVNRFVSFYGNAGYTYDGKYTATGSLRWDRSNLWGTDNKYQNKPTWSAGASWNVSKEDFFQLSSVDMLKLRFSYGIGGNIAKNSAPYMTAYYFPSSTVGGTYGYVRSRPNPELSWEKTATTNIGVDFSVLKQRLSGTVEFYNKKGSDLLANTQGVPTEGWGYSTYTINNGEMQNRGIELTLNGEIIKTSDFGWNASLLYGYNKNKVTYVNVEAPVYFLQLDYPSEFPRIGTPYNSIYGYKWAGLSETGLPQVYDSEGNALTYQPSDLESIENLGTTVPKHSGSFNTSFRYKNFDLSALFIYQLGHKIRNTYLPMLGNSYVWQAGGYITNIAVGNNRINERWQQPGDELTTDVPRTVYEYDSEFNYALYSIYSNSSANVLNASNIRLSNVSLAYNIPENLLTKLKLQSVRLNFNVENVFTLAKSDDAKYMLGGYRSPNYVFGINVNF
ncbi:SusC/RagA family TonB-linked outer membrane protein [Draconibacterium sediminis]|uniref:SusC/RagA family TonB-linked outer membrane protein n=1 Tax=Draconibacterium sediminis TaxID=1544798 RepID=UPI0026EF059B|nr:SusC/RagA family TonB-linked outer membrane protein [Draconibacterium sediminis]